MGLPISDEAPAELARALGLPEDVELRGGPLVDGAPCLEAKGELVPIRREVPLEDEDDEEIPAASRAGSRKKGKGPKAPRVSDALIRNWREGMDRTPFLAWPDSVDAVVPGPEEPAWALSQGRPIWKSVRRRYNRIVRMDRKQHEYRDAVAGLDAGWAKIIENTVEMLKEAGMPAAMRNFHRDIWLQVVMTSAPGKAGEILRLKKDIEETLGAWAARDMEASGLGAKRKKTRSRT